MVEQSRGSVNILRVVGAAIVSGERCLVAQRGPKMSLASKWEFPGGKVELGEPPRVALAREIFEELGLHVTVAEQLGTGSANAGARVVVLDVYVATITSGTLALSEHAQAKWATAAELAAFDWAEADVPIVPAVARWLRSRA